MKVTFLADNLQKKLSLVNHAIAARPQLPILSTLFLEARQGKLHLSGTDLEIGIQSAIPADIEEEGSVAVPAKTFTELISSLSQEKITLRTLDSGLEVKSTHTKSLFQTMNKDEFPTLFKEKGVHVATFSTKDLRTIFSSVIFAASSDTNRPALSGVLVRKEEQGFLLVATDGYRLSLKHSSVEESPQGLKEEMAMIVPARIFREVLSSREEGESVTMYISTEQHQILFSFPETTIIGRLIEAEFPQYEKILPSDFSAVITFQREDLLKAVKICSIFARDTANIIQLSLRQQKLIVSSQSSSLGENTVEVEAQLTGEENEIAFNARYLLDALANIEEEELSFEMTGPLNAGVFKIKENASFLHLIMPIRVQG